MIQITATILCALLLAGCSFQITGEGLQWSAGQSSATTCDEGAVGQVPDCSSTSGGAISDTGSKSFGDFLRALPFLGGMF